MRSKSNQMFVLAHVGYHMLGKLVQKPVALDQMFRATCCVSDGRGDGTLHELCARDNRIVVQEGLVTPGTGTGTAH